MNLRECSFVKGWEHRREYFELAHSNYNRGEISDFLTQREEEIDRICNKGLLGVSLFCAYVAGMVIRGTFFEPVWPFFLQDEKLTELNKDIRCWRKQDLL